MNYRPIARTVAAACSLAIMLGGCSAESDTAGNQASSGPDATQSPTPSNAPSPSTAPSIGPSADLPSSELDSGPKVSMREFCESLGVQDDIASYLDVPRDALTLEVNDEGGLGLVCDFQHPGLWITIQYAELADGFECGASTGTNMLRRRDGDIALYAWGSAIRCLPHAWLTVVESGRATTVSDEKLEELADILRSIEHRVPDFAARWQAAGLPTS